MRSSVQTDFWLEDRDRRRRMRDLGVEGIRRDVQKDVGEIWLPVKKRVKDDSAVF